MEDLESIYEQKILLENGYVDHARNNMYSDRPAEETALARFKRKYGHEPNQDPIDLADQEEEMTEGEEAAISDKIIKHIKGLRKIARDMGIDGGSRNYLS